ncbi:uncharacterized protein LOC133338474, partial [Musca vetustissima]|uniref:uncharacterized protein LOC133338474 n=1 Tax=Musca vetustissima TaxID=27455 RepID=UPI002AB7666F
RTFGSIMNYSPHLGLAKLISISSIVFISVCLAMAMANTQVLNKLPANLNFLDFMTSSTSNIEANPEQSMACFSYYVPLINEIAQTYAAELADCSNVATQAEANAEAATLDIRNTFATAVNSSCAALVQCPQAGTVEDIFQCYINQGTDESKIFYSLSANATMQLSDFVELITEIKSELDVCNTQAEVKYEKDSAVVYSNLNSCILGQSAVPTTTIEPITTTTVSSSSEAPVPSTTGVSSSTDASSTTTVSSTSPVSSTTGVSSTTTTVANDTA